MLASRSFFVFIIFLAAFVAQTFAIPSPLPWQSCGAYVCPPSDSVALPLDAAHSGLTNNGQTLHCEYPSGHQVGQFYCEYSASTGVMTVDNDNGWCSWTASTPNCGRRRSPNVYARRSRARAMKA